ncbi:MAG TPA: hypothetical protein VM659_16005 [Dongiaceae bacterium]|nr:hypothetical protein [Dongiaceae bacterium]
MKSIPEYVIGIFIAGMILLRIVTGWFNSELRKSDPKLYERVGRPGDSNVDWPDYKNQQKFFFWLLFGGYLKFQNRRLVILGAIQHAWLIAIIGYVIYVVVGSILCRQC